MSPVIETSRPGEKLRESCNTCATSKVRCSKDQPSCVRCLNRNIPCHYSPSRRTGKRRPTIEGPASTSSNLHTNATSGLACSPEPPSLSQHLPSPSTNSCRSSYHLLPDPTTGPSSDDKALPSDNPFTMTGAESGHLSFSPSLRRDTSDNTDSHCLDNMNVDFGALPTPPNFDGILPNDISLPGSALSGLAAPYQSAPLAPACLSQSPTKPQDCMHFAINILQGLHATPSTCSLAFGTPVDTSNSPAPAIDHVITTNRSVIESLNPLFTCPCSLNAQVTLILTLIGSKIIAWYRAILKNDENSNATSSSGSCDSDEVIVGAESVSDCPITVGRYNLEGADKGKMRAQLVLSELRHVSGLVEQLTEHLEKQRAGIAVAPDTASHVGDTKHVIPLCEHLLLFLKNGVQSVAQEAVRCL